MGFVSRDRIALGNLMTARVVLLMLLCSVRAVTFLVEQPTSSLMPRHARWRAVLDGGLLRMYTCNFCMGIFGAETVKPTTLWSNSRKLLEMVMLVYQARRCTRTTTKWLSTTTVEVDPVTGKKAVTGNENLKGTQPSAQLCSLIRSCA